MKKTLSCCFTGYRPQKFPFPLEKGNGEYNKFENALTDAILLTLSEGCRTFYSGMAQGFDIIAAETVLELRKSEHFSDIKLVCALPFAGQANGFAPEWRERYDKILNEADEVITVCLSYSKDCFFRRNQFMVDSTDCVITWFDGAAGGTKNTVCYARKIGRKIVNIYDSFSAQNQTSFFDIYP